MFITNAGRICREQKSEFYLYLLDRDLISITKITKPDANAIFFPLANLTAAKPGDS